MPSCLYLVSELNSFFSLSLKMMVVILYSYTFPRNDTMNWLDNATFAVVAAYLSFAVHIINPKIERTAFTNMRERSSSPSFLIRLELEAWLKKSSKCRCKTDIFRRSRNLIRAFLESSRKSGCHLFYDEQRSIRPRLKSYKPSFGRVSIARIHVFFFPRREKERNHTSLVFFGIEILKRSAALKSVASSS